MTIQVTSLADNGPGTLREAINYANKKNQGTIITFQVIGVIITLSSPLPTVTTYLNLQGNKQIEIDFNRNNGLVFGTGAAGSIIEGLAFTNSNGDAITINTDKIQIYDNYVGLSWNGQAKGNMGSGIVVTSAKGITIGRNPGSISASPSNVISNNNYGIIINNASKLTIASNFIGTDPSGKISFPNLLGGIYITGGSSNITIGGTIYTNSNGVTNNPTGSIGTEPPVFIFPPLGNLISGNKGEGVLVDGNSNDISIYGNFIGVDVTGIAPLSNNYGISLTNCNNISILGCKPTTKPFAYYNVCSGNKFNGIKIVDANNITVQGNFIGIGADNATVVANDSHGIFIGGSSDTITVGGVIPLGNVCSGNGGDGIHLVDGVTNFLSFNTFAGLFAFGASAPNRESGIHIGTNVTGKDNTIRTSILSGNLKQGLHITDDSSKITVEECIIGMDTSGTIALPNGEDGIKLSRNANNCTIGVNVSSMIPRNIFSGNIKNGIHITDNAHNNLISYSYVGLAIDGKTASGNQENGILIEGSAHDNYVGTPLAPPAVYTNYVCGNGGYGISLAGNCTRNIIIYNYIGLDVEGNPVPNTLGIINNSSSGNNIITNNFY